MKNLVVPYNIAIELKKLGFNRKCFAFYNEDKLPIHFERLDVFWNDNNEVQFARKMKNLFRTKKVKDIMCLAPTWEQVTSWFLTKKIHVTFEPIYINKAFGLTEIDCYIPHCVYDYYDLEYKTPEEAYTEAIFKGIEILKNK